VGHLLFCARKNSQTQLSLIEVNLISCLGETLQLRRLVAFAIESLHLSMQDLVEAYNFYLCCPAWIRWRRVSLIVVRGGIVEL
jgi:hypothetical protein